jgi:hypothetical protein
MEAACLLTFNGLHTVITQKREHFIAIAVRTSSAAIATISWMQWSSFYKPSEQFNRL